MAEKRPEVLDDPINSIDVRIRELGPWMSLFGGCGEWGLVEKYADIKLAECINVVLAPPKGMAPEEVERFRGQAAAWSNVRKLSDNMKLELMKLQALRSELVVPKEEELVGPRVEDQWYGNR